MNEMGGLYMKKILKLLTMFTLLITLTGCMKLNLSIVIKDENNIEAGMEVLYAESLLQQMGENVEDVMASMVDGKYENWTSTPVERTIDDQKYVGAKMTAPVEDAKNAYAQYLTVDKQSSKTIYTLDLPTNTLPQGDENSLPTDENQPFNIEEAKQAGLEMNTSVTMPGKVIESSIGEIKGNTVHIDLLSISSTDTNIKIISEVNSNSSFLPSVFISIGVIVVAGGVIMILKKRKSA